MALVEILGLPAHPLIVDVAVVFLPLTAVVTVVATIVPWTRWQDAPVALARAVFAVVTAAGATWSVVSVGHSGATATWSEIDDAD